MLSTFVITPFLAKYGGREPLPYSGNLKPLTFWTVMLNRHYVDPNLKSVLIEVSDVLEEKHPNSVVNYLDANFPFINGFPLIPHLSHNDGRKVDLAFLYMEAHSGLPNNSAPSIIGYGVYEDPVVGEVDYPNECKSLGYWQYGFIRNLIPKWKSMSYALDEKRTSFLLRELLKQPMISKVFLEPHLK